MVRSFVIFGGSRRRTLQAIVQKSGSADGTPHGLLPTNPIKQRKNHHTDLRHTYQQLH